jgi:hypothetical protein
MRAPHFAGLAAKVLTRATPPVVPPRESERAEAIRLIEQAILQKARRKRRVRWAYAGGVALAVAASAALLLRAPQRAVALASPVVVAVGQPTGSGVRLLTSTGSEPLLSGSPLPPGGRLVADANGGAALHLSTGTEIAIEHNANLTFNDAGPTEQFVLSEGSIHAHVAKLAAGQRFIVSTPDAEVEVRGTRFTVGIVDADASCGAGTRTRVAVSEGVVEVRSGGLSSFVHPGESWPAHCSAGTATVAKTEEPGRTSSAPRAATPGGALRGSAPSASVEPVTVASRLAEQNDLFAQGVAARRSGDSARAISAFDTLLSRYPSSALAESATAERMRALAKANPMAAQRAAKEYLARYSQGFARRDAEAILAGP